MSVIEARGHRVLFLLVLCFACWRSAEFSPASAQERSRPSTPASSPVETSSQRLLPLPAGASPDLKQQVQWLQQLRGLLASGELGSDTSVPPKIDPEQLNALLNAMKQFSGAVPPGTVLPKPSENPSSEQILKMMSDPAVQELMKRFLQQAGRQPKQPLNDPKSGDPSVKPANPDREPVEPAAPSPADKPKPPGSLPTDAERSVTRPRIPGFLDDELTTNFERARKEVEAILRDSRNDLSLPPRTSKTDQKPFGPLKLGSEIEKDGTASGVSKPSRSTTEKPIRELPAAPPSSKPAVTPAITSDSPKSPQMDVRSELQQNGFAQTLRKLIDQTRVESRAESNGSAGTSAESQDPGKGSLSGLEKSITRLFEGLRKDAAREASKTPAPMPATAASPQPSTPPSGPEQRSTAGKVFESVGNVFKEMAAAPETQPGNARTRPGRSSSRSSDSLGVTSGSTGPLLLLLAALGLVWYFLPRVVTAVKESQLLRRSNSAGEVTSSADIRTRQDVVRAFHQYAMQSAMSVPDWWTHREVERQVAETTPALKPSIQVLADVYELARYLPGDAELTPDQIGIVRRELENVSQSQFAGSRR